MTGHPTEQTPSTSASGPSGIFTGPASAADTAPMTLPTRRLIAGGLVGAVLAVLAVIGIVIVTRGSDPAHLLAAGGGAACGWLASVGGVLTLRPWRPRPEGRWPFVLLGAQALSCVGALFLAGLLYFSTRPDAVPLALATTGGFIGTWVGQVRVFSAQFQARHSRSSR